MRRAASALCQFSSLPAYLSLLGIAEPELHAVVLEAERLEHELHEVERGAELVLDLLGRAEEMGVVLGEAADAGHAV